MPKEIDKKSPITKEQRGDFELHVRLLTRAGYKVAEARTLAWLQGPDGLRNMLAQMNVTG